MAAEDKAVAYLWKVFVGLFLLLSMALSYLVVWHMRFDGILSMVVALEWGSIAIEWGLTSTWIACVYAFNFLAYCTFLVCHGKVF